MKITHLRICNFRCFGGVETEIALDDTTFILGPNGAGKTAVLQVLARMFSLDPAQRKIRTVDCHRELTRHFHRDLTHPVVMFFAL